MSPGHHATSACGLAVSLTAGFACAHCPRTPAEGPFAACRQRVLHAHGELLKDTVAQALASRSGGSEEALRASMLRVLTHAQAMLDSLGSVAEAPPPLPETLPLDAAQAPHHLAASAGGLLWFD